MSVHTVSNKKTFVITGSIYTEKGIEAVHSFLYVSLRRHYVSGRSHTTDRACELCKVFPLKLVKRSSGGVSRRQVITFLQ